MKLICIILIYISLVYLYFYVKLILYVIPMEELSTDGIGSINKKKK